LSAGSTIEPTDAAELVASPLRESAGVTAVMISAAVVR
jgi:hypothetical protein